MAIDPATTIADLNTSLPSDQDPAGEGDDNLRHIKQVLQNCFGGVDGQILNAQGTPATAQDFKDLFDAVLAAQGASAFIQGQIMLWSGSEASIPSGWSLCDGAGGTPDLRNRFVIGAGDAYNVGETGGSAPSGGKVTTDPGGSHSHGLTIPDHVLATANLPEHDHKLFTASENPSNTDTRPTGTQYASSKRGTSGDNGNDYMVAAAVNAEVPSLGITGKAGVPSPDAITHNGATTDAGGDHTHTLDAALPPYWALCYIMYTG